VVVYLGRGILNVDSDCAEHVHNAKAAVIVSGRIDRGKLGTHAMAREEGTPMSGIAANDLFSAKTPTSERPTRSREKPTVNWYDLSMEGRNGLPAAACQTSCSEESMCLTEEARVI
jgi:hypothetical protein